MSPNKAHMMASMKQMQKPGGPGLMPSSQSSGLPGHGFPTIHREVTYPLDSVEATQPQLKPRRRLTSKEVGKKLSSSNKQLLNGMATTRF